MNTNIVTSTFQTIHKDFSGNISINDILSKLQRQGLLPSDPRLTSLSGHKNFVDNALPVDAKTFYRLFKKSVTLLHRAVNQDFIIPGFENFSDDVAEIFADTVTNTSGEVASYIPQLAQVNPRLFAVAICTIDGQQLILGDSDVPFCFQSTCKPVLYSAAMELYGEDWVHRHIGWESSGKSFNELALNQSGLPHNPMINAGAIMSAGMIKPELPMADRFDFLVNLVSTLTGSKPGFNNAVFHSEKDSADRNFALAHYMREEGAFPRGTDMHQALDLYFSACSMEVTVADLAKIGATLANGGVNPFAADAIFSRDTVKNCLSMMNIAGMYDYSGEFAFRIGMPAKSGVSGAVLAVIPNVMSIAVWSPRLDQYGNSVRGVEFLRRLVEKFNFHNYDSLVSTDKVDPRKKTPLIPDNLDQAIINAVKLGDVYELKRLNRLGATLHFCGSDGETLLHMASAKGHVDMVLYLVTQGLTVDAMNKYDETPYDVAMRRRHFDVMEVLEQEQLKHQQVPEQIRNEAQYTFIPLPMKIAEVAS